MTEFELATAAFQNATIEFQNATIQFQKWGVIGQYAIGLLQVALIAYGLRLMERGGARRAALAEERAASERRHEEAMAESEKRHEEAMAALTELIRRTGGGGGS